MATIKMQAIVKENQMEHEAESRGLYSDICVFIYIYTYTHTYSYMYIHTHTQLWAWTRRWKLYIVLVKLVCDCALWVEEAGSFRVHKTRPS